MYQPSVFSVKLHLHFGGDVHEISVPAYGGAEPTVTDVMNVVERDFRVPRALQNLVFHGQDLHTRSNEPLSHFGIKNGAAIRLVGRMAPPELINQINAQYNTYSYQQPSYNQQQPYYPQQQPYYPQQQPYYLQQQPSYNQQQPLYTQQQQPNPIPIYPTIEQNSSYYSEQFQYPQNPSSATQYDPPPPPTPQNKIQPPPTPQNTTQAPLTPQNKTQAPLTPQNKTQPPSTPQNKTQPPPTPQNTTQSPSTSQNKTQPPPTPQNKIQSPPPPPTPNQGKISESSNGQEKKLSATPNSSNPK
jgi:hypothetical protein